MNTQLAIKSASLLPETLVHLLAQPSSAAVEQLHWQYQQACKRLRDVEEILSANAYSHAITLLMQSANHDPNQPVPHRLEARDINIAMQLLQKDYWSKAINLTDVAEHMPQDRRYSWHEALEAFDFPEFTLDNVYQTLSTLLNERDKFFAERVDGVFRALSGEHVTNQPSGF